MLAIRMQRTGRSGRAMFRVVVQDARRTPTSGKVVALLGSYDPRAKALTLNKEQASFYLKNGAQPSERAARLLEAEGVHMPKWVAVHINKQGKLRNPAKLRRNQPKDTAVEAPVETPVEAAAPGAEAPATGQEIIADTIETKEA